MGNWELLVPWRPYSEPQPFLQSDQNYTLMKYRMKVKVNTNNCSATVTELLLNSAEMVRYHQNAWTTEVCYAYLIRLVWSHPVARSHSWQTNAVEPLPIWCSLLFLERLGGLFSQPEGVSLCSEQRHNQGHLWLERHCPSGPCVQTNPGDDRQMPYLK